MIRHNKSVRLTMDPCTPRPSSGPYLTPQLERAIAARWKMWVPWVRMQLLLACQTDPTVDPAIDGADSRRLRQRHSQHILDMLRTGITMRTIRRHRLDDPRITDETRAVLVQATMERHSKARFRRSQEQRKQDRLWMLIRLGPIAGNAPTMSPANDLPEERSPAATPVTDPLSLQSTIQFNPPASV